MIVAGQHLGELDRAGLAGLRRREVALVTQEPGLIPYLTALENVELGIRLRSEHPEPSPRAREALVAVGLGDRVGRHAANLLRRRARAGRDRPGACLGCEHCLLVDEPTARLDEENARRVGALLAAAAHERGLAVICATHDPVLFDVMDELVELSKTVPAHGGSRVPVSLSYVSENRRRRPT